MQENVALQSTVISEQSMVPEQKTPPTVDRSQSSFLVILLSILLIISVSIAGFFAFQTQKLVKELNALKSEANVTPVATMEPTIDPTANWEVFTDKMTNFTFKYPLKYKITTIARDSGDGFSYLFSPDNLITVTLLTKYTDNQSEFYMDAPKTSDVSIGKNIWRTYFLPQGYSDGAVGAGKPIYGMQTEINKKLFSITLFDQKEVTQEQKQILSSFEFLD